MQDSSHPSAPEEPAQARKRDVSLSMGRVNLIAIPAALLLCLATLAPFILLWGGRSLLEGGRDLARWYVLVPGLLAAVAAELTMGRSSVTSYQVAEST